MVINQHLFASSLVDKGNLELERVDIVLIG